mgnify:CR=1 FL=1
MSLLEYCVNKSDNVRTTGVVSDSKAERLQQWEEQKKQAYDLAFNKIIENYEDKLKNAAESGYKKAEIYKYKTTDDIKFNGIYVSDCLRKGDVMDRLKKHFDGFNVKLNRVTKNKDVVTVSWYPNRKNRPQRVKTNAGTNVETVQ